MMKLKFLLQYLEPFVSIMDKWRAIRREYRVIRTESIDINITLSSCDTIRIHHAQKWSHSRPHLDLFWSTSTWKCICESMKNQVVPRPLASSWSMTQPRPPRRTLVSIFIQKRIVGMLLLLLVFVEGAVYNPLTQPRSTSWPSYRCRTVAWLSCLAWSPCLRVGLLSAAMCRSLRWSRMYHSTLPSISSSVFIRTQIFSYPCISMDH